MVHIAYVLATFPEPSETFVVREVEALQRRGFRITVWAIRDSGDAGHAGLEFPEGPRVLYRPSAASRDGIVHLLALAACHPVRFATVLAYACILAVHSPRWAAALLRNLHAVACFARDAQREGVDHIHGYFLNLPAVLAMAVAILARLPFTVAGHARDIFVCPGPVAFLVRHAQGVILCSKAVASELGKHIPKEMRPRLQVIRHGIDTTRWKAPSSNGRIHKDDVPTILAIGRLVEKKGFDVLLRSCAVLRDRAIAFRLLIVGDGPQAQRLRRSVVREGLAERVVLTGWMRQVHLRQIMGTATALAVPSVVARDGDQDGIPNVVLEAAACGVPVVASRLPGMTEAVEDGVTGVLVGPGDHQALARGIERILRNQDWRERLAERGRRKVERDFDIRRNARLIGQVFLNVRHAGEGH